jgi:hypothetical protein
MSRATAEETLDKQIDAGGELVDRGEHRTAHKRDYQRWAVIRQTWVEVTTQALRHLYASDTQAEEFQQVASPAASLGPRPWNLQLDRERKATVGGVRKLESLRAQLPYASLASSGAIRHSTSRSSDEENPKKHSRRTPLFGRLTWLPKPLGTIADIITIGTAIAVGIRLLIPIGGGGGPVVTHSPKQKGSSPSPEVHNIEKGSSHSEVRNIEYHGTEDFLGGKVIVTISRLDDDQPGLETTIRRTVVTSSGKSCPFHNLGVGSEVTQMKPGRPTYVVLFLKKVGYGVAVQVSQRKEQPHSPECMRER